ncbi:hypothetical protein D9M68_965310 [compost metagenome]
MSKNLRLRLEPEHAFTLRNDAVKGRVDWGLAVSKLKQLVTRNCVGCRHIFRSNLEWHIDLLHPLL